MEALTYFENPKEEIVLLKGQLFVDNSNFMLKDFSLHLGISNSVNIAPLARCCALKVPFTWELYNAFIQG